MKDKKVLVATPTYEGMKYCIKQFLDRIKGLEYKNYDILVVDNSNTDDFFNELSEDIRIKVIKDENKDVNMKRIVSSRNIVIDYALDNSYDYILMMDCDVIPPISVIDDLISCDKDIVSGVYFNYFVSSGKVKVLPVAWMAVTESEFQEMKKQGLPNHVNSRFDINRHMTLDEVKSDKLFNVSHPSAGCMLISRKVFEKVKYGLFNMEEIYGKNTKLKTSDDIYFIQKAKENGFESFCFTKVKCDHVIGGKFDSSGGKHPAY